MGNNYFTHLKDMSDDKSFQRKMEYLDYNFRPIIKEFQPREDMSILEIGPGRGECIEYLNGQGISNIDVVDNDKKILSLLKRKYKIRDSYINSVITSIKHKLKRYDLIILVQVLEHMSLREHPRIIKTLYSHLKNNGHILIVVPNASNPLGLVERYGDLQHKTSFTEQSLKDLVNVSEINNFKMEIKNYKIPPYSLLNIVRILLQKILHQFLLLMLMVNGGVYFKTLSPNILLKIKKLS